MSSPFQRLVRSMFVLSGANLVQSVASFLLLPIYTRYLSPADYGAAEMLVVSVGLSSVFVHQGLPSAVMRYYLYVHGGDRTAQRLVVSSALGYLVACAVAYGLALSLLASPVSELLFGTREHALLVPAGLSMVLFIGLDQIANCVLRANERAAAVSAVSLFGFACRALLTLYLLVGRGWGFESLIWGHLLGHFAQSCTSLGLVRAELAWTFSRERLLGMLRYGLPLVLAGASFFALNLSNRFFLRYLVDNAEVGLYSMGDRMAGVLNLLFFQPFGRMWGPAFFQVARSDDAPERLARFATQFVGVGLVLVVAALCLVELPVRWLLAADFHPSARVVPVLALAYFLLALSEVVKVGMNITGHTRALPVRVVVAALVSVSMNLALVPTYGFVGAAASAVLAYGVLCASSWLLSQRYFPIPYERGRLAVALAGALAAALLHGATGPLPPPARFGAGVAIVAAYAAFLWRARILEPQALLRAVRAGRSPEEEGTPSLPGPG